MKNANNDPQSCIRKDFGDNTGTNQQVEANAAAKRVKKSSGVDNLMEVPSDEPSVEGTFVDPVPAH